MAPGRVIRGAVVLLAALLGGCGSAAQDFSDFSKSLFPPSPAEAAKMMFDPYDPDHRREGTVLISNAPFGGEEAYLRAYRDMVKEERDPGVRAVAIRALARWGSAEDAPLIEPNLTHSNRHVRWEAATGLQRLHNPAVVPALLRVLSKVDEDVDVRAAAATALGQYPQDRVFQGLIAALDERELEVNLAAARSLEIQTGQKHGLDPDTWLGWYGEQTEPFSGGGEFLYPTYVRRESFLEMLAFWGKKTWEAPAPPTGLRPRSQRDTYEDSEGASGDDKAR